MKNQDSIGHLIGCLHRQARIYFDREMSGFGLGSGTFIFLLLLYKNDGISQNELSKMLNFDKANTTRGIKKLLELGYVRREKDKNDSRAYKLYITRKSNEIKADIITVLESWTEVLSSGLTESEIQQSFNLLEKMKDNAINFKKLNL